MPTILRELGFQFYFFANEHLPKHIHVQKGEELRNLKHIIDHNKDYFTRSWNEYFGN